MARGLSRVLFSAAVGAKTPVARQHRSTIALAGFPSQKKGLGGDIRQLATRAPAPIPPHHSLKMCPCRKSTKTFVRQLSSLLLQLRTVTAHVRALWVWPRQHQILHVGYSHKTSNTVFLIYDYCVSVTNIAGVCKSIHRELGGRLGLEKPQKREGGGFCSGWLTSPCESVHVTSELSED